MIPLQKIKDIILRHSELEKDMSSGKVDPKLFAKKSKEYSSLESIIFIAREYIDYSKVKKDLEQILQDKNNDSEIKKMAEKDLKDLEQKKISNEDKLKIFLQKDEDDDKVEL